MRITTFLALVIATPIFIGCSESSAPRATPPTVPPQQALELDVAYFEQFGVAGDGGQTAGAPGSAFITAAFVVGVAKAATFLVLAPPALGLAAATSQSAVFESGAFHWQYTTSGYGYSYEIDLSAEPSGDEAIWEMRVNSTTHVPALNNFLWASGRSAFDGTEGDLRLFDASTPGTSTEVLQVDWTFDGTESRSLTLRNVKQGSADFGDIVHFQRLGSTRSVLITDASASTETLVWWDSAQHIGYIEAPNINGGVRACWNATLSNVPCDE